MRPASCHILHVLLATSATFALAAPNRQVRPQTSRPMSPQPTTSQGALLDLLAREETPLTTIFWPYSEDVSDSDSRGCQLPPISEVFMSMAANSLVLMSPSATSPPAQALLSSASLMHSEPTITPLWGPGVEIAPPSFSMLATTPAPDASALPTPTVTKPIISHKLVIIASVIGGTALISLCFILFANPGLCCWRKKALASGQGPSLRPPDIENEVAYEKDVVKSREDRVIDIKRNFTGSKFSVTSSDYPHSYRSSPSLDAISVYSDPTSCIQDAFESSRKSASLLTPAEIFSLPSPSPSFSSLNSNHSHTRSVPTFGHSSTGRRRSERRKSKSATITPELEWDIGMEYGTQHSTSIGVEVPLAYERTRDGRRSLTSSWISLS